MIKFWVSVEISQFIVSAGTQGIAPGQNFLCTFSIIIFFSSSPFSIVIFSHCHLFFHQHFFSIIIFFIFFHQLMKFILIFNHNKKESKWKTRMEIENEIALVHWDCGSHSKKHEGGKGGGVSLLSDKASPTHQICY